MTITRSEILAEVKTRTNRTELNSVDTPLLATMQFLSSLHPFLQRSSTVTITSTSGAPPSDYRKIDSVVDGGLPLEKLDSFDEYLSWLGTNAEETAQGSRYAVYDNKVWLWPPTNTPTRDVTVYMSYRSDDVTNIEFPDEFREALVEGTCYKAYQSVGQGATPEAADHKRNFDEEVQALLAGSPNKDE